MQIEKPAKGAERVCKYCASEHTFRLPATLITSMRFFWRAELGSGMSTSASICVLKKMKR